MVSMAPNHVIFNDSISLKKGIDTTLIHVQKPIQAITNMQSVPVKPVCKIIPFRESLMRELGHSFVKSMEANILKGITHQRNLYNTNTARETPQYRKITTLGETPPALDNKIK